MSVKVDDTVKYMELQDLVSFPFTRHCPQKMFCLKSTAGERKEIYVYIPVTVLLSLLASLPQKLTARSCLLCVSNNCKLLRYGFKASLSYRVFVN